MPLPPSYTLLINAVTPVHSITMTYPSAPAGSSLFENTMQQLSQNLKQQAAVTLQIEETLALHRAQLHTLQQQEKEYVQTLETYCRTHKQTLFSKRRSTGSPSGKAGFRLGQPHLVLPKGQTWQSIENQLLQLLPQYARTTTCIAKDALLARRYTHEVATALMSLGIRIEQKEIFYVKPYK